VFFFNRGSLEQRVNGFFFHDEKGGLVFFLLAAHSEPIYKPFTKILGHPTEM